MLNWGNLCSEVWDGATQIKNLAINEGERHSIVVMVSGGMDSATLLGLAKYMEPEKIIGLSFDYGQRHDKEIPLSHPALGGRPKSSQESSCRTEFAST